MKVIPTAVALGLVAAACSFPASPSAVDPGIAAAPATATVVCFGDSTTANRTVGGRSLPIFVHHLRRELAGIGLPGPVVNSGVRGSHTGSRSDDARHRVAHASDRFRAAVLDQQPDLVILQFGLNDCWIDRDGGLGQRRSRIPLADYRRNLERFVTACRAHGAAVVLMTPNALGSRYPDWRAATLARYADAVRELAATARVPLVDVHRHFAGQRDPDRLLLDGMHPNAAGHRWIADQLLATIADLHRRGDLRARNRRRPTHYTLPILDLSGDRHRQVVVDREPGQYLGHPTTVLLEDQRTMLTVYPKGHGRGAIVMKRSTDAGRTWSERLPVPSSWRTSKEVPTLHRVVDATGKRRIIMFSGLYPCRMAVSEDDGRTWSELRPVGDWGGIVVMSGLVALRRPGHYLGMFHDDGRFFTAGGQQQFQADRQAGKPRVFRLYKTFSADGGLTWSSPAEVWSGSHLHLCEPGIVRSPDGATLAVLLRENSRRRNSHVVFSHDEGRTFDTPRELPAALTGDRHTGRYAPDGRLFVSFRDRTLVSPTFGDWVAWVGTFEDLVQGRQGQYRVRLMDNHKGADCAYPGVEVLPDGTMVTTTYGHWAPGQSPYIASVRLQLAELDRLARTTSR